MSVKKKSAMTVLDAIPYYDTDERCVIVHEIPKNITPEAEAGLKRIRELLGVEDMVQPSP